MGGGQRRRRRLGGVGATSAGATATACPTHASALVGKIGSGKSATANSILGDKAFASKRSYSGVTQTCQIKSRTFGEGSESRTVNIIDTPGLFDMDIKVEDIMKEIVKCMNLAKDGIHAMLIVFNATSRFSHEDEHTIETIKLFFRGKIFDHMIFVFTHGDQVDESDWKEMLTESAPRYLQEAHQTPKSNKEIGDEYFTQISQMVEDKIKSVTERLEKRVQEGEKRNQEMRDEIRGLKESLEKAQKENEKLKAEQKSSQKGKEDNSCIIL